MSWIKFLNCAIAYEHTFQSHLFSPLSPCLVHYETRWNEDRHCASALGALGSSPIPLSIRTLSAPLLPPAYHSNDPKFQLTANTILQVQNVLARIHRAIDGLLSEDPAYVGITAP